MSKIHKILSSDEKISGCGGLALLLRYIQWAGFIKMASGIFDLALPYKGLTLSGFLKQMMAHFMNRDSMSLVDFDQKSFDCFEDEIKIGYVVMGRKYKDDGQYLQDIPNDGYGVYQKEKCAWEYIEYDHKLKSWEKFRRCIYTRLTCEHKGQTAFSFSQTDAIIYTNLGTGPVFSW